MNPITTAQVLAAGTLAAGTLAAGPAFALGMLVAPTGNQAHIVRSRTLVVRHVDKVQLITQIKLDTAAPKVGWLIPVTNVENPADNGVRVSVFPVAALNALDAATSPHVVGVCPDGPTGEEHTVPFGDGWRSGQPMANARIISAGEIANGDLTNYLQGRDYEITAAAQDAIDTMHDQNFMFAVVNIDPAGAAVDPIVSIEYPLAEASEPRLGLYPLVAALNGPRADALFFALNTFQMKAHLPTRLWDLAGVQFVSDEETTYTSALEAYLDSQSQTQAVVLEYGQAVPADLQDADLTALVTAAGATHLTRLRASFQPAAISSNVKTLTLRKAAADAPDTGREREIPGRACNAAPDMGETGGAGGSGGAGGEPTGGTPTGGMVIVGDDGGPGTGGTVVGADAGAGGVSSDDGGGGGGGCHLGPHGPIDHAVPFLAVFGLLLTTIGLRRRRP